MGCKLIWNGTASQRTLEDPNEFRGWRNVTKQVVRSAAGVPETATLEAFDEIDVLIENFDQQADRNALSSWWSYAGRGEEFAFALESDKTASTTTNATLSAADTTVSVASVTGFAAADEIMLIDTDGLLSERATVTSVDTTNSDLIVSAGIWNGYNNGATVRHADYYPRLVCDDDREPVTENPGLTWTLRLRAREAKSA